MKDECRLVLVTQKGQTPLTNYLDFVETCISGGVTAVQLREKALDRDGLKQLARQLQEILRPKAIPLIMNDDVNLALAVDADGLHLGQSDGNIRAARDAIGPDKILGLSVNSMEQIQSANTQPIDYIGVSAIFPTKNKPNVEFIWGCDGLQTAVQHSVHPAVAIGGIDLNTIADVVETGVYGVAAIGAFHDADDPARAASEMIQHIQRREKNAA